jgi:hypothetical protein
MRLLIFILISCSFLANAKEIEHWRLGSTLLAFFPQKNGVLISQHCLKNKKCDALKPMNKTITLFNGGVNPASEICQNNHGMVFIAEKNHSTQGFCRFKDHSIISLNGLMP